MAKNKNKQQPKRNGRSRKRRARGGAGRSAVSEKVLSYAALLADPCEADVPEASVYPGETGIVSRFASEVAIGGGAGETCGFIAYHPNDNTVCVVTQALPTTTFVINAGSFIYNSVPGSTFLLASARKMRSLAACITAMPNSSTLNATGDIAVGNVSLSTLFATATSVTQVFSLLTKRAPIIRKNFEVRFVPGEMDQRYSNVLLGANPSLTGTDDTDTNVVVLAWRGLPAASGLNYRLTNVIEWTPLLNAGLTVSTATDPGMPHGAVVHEMHKHNPGWWHTLVEGVGHDIGIAGRYVGRMALDYGAKSIGAALGSSFSKGGLLLM